MGRPWPGAADVESERPEQRTSIDWGSRGGCKKKPKKNVRDREDSGGGDRRRRDESPCAIGSGLWGRLNSR